jgi:YHS domain-containing protein
VAVRVVETDPVCGMTVTPSTSTPNLDHAGQTWWFCSTGCRDQFASAQVDVELTGGVPR